MPNRILKESVCTSEKINDLSDFNFRLWACLITYVDDYGRGDARPAVIKGRCFPLRDRVTVKDIDSGLHVLADTGCVSLYTVDGEPYLCFPNWSKHQSIRNKKSKYPGPDQADAPTKTVDSICMQLNSIDCKCSRNPIQSESNPNPNPIREVGANAPLPTTRRFIPPTVEEVASYAMEKGYRIDPARFVDFYASKGWKVGSSPMKDWKAAVRNWAGRDRYEPAPQQLPCHDPPRQTYPDVPYDELPDNIRKIVKRDEWA